VTRARVVGGGMIQWRHSTLKKEVKHPDFSSDGGVILH
jgi:hypothetical protein